MVISVANTGCPECSSSVSAFTPIPKIIVHTMINNSDYIEYAKLSNYHGQNVPSKSVVAETEGGWIGSVVVGNALAEVAVGVSLAALLIDV